MAIESPVTLGEKPTRLSPIAARDWALWVDWCTATDRDPHHTGGAALAAFLRELPAATLVQDRRVRNIRRILEGTGRGLPRPTTTIRPRVGPEWLTYPDALAALRHEWWPEGVAARRDALILVLIAHGFTRTRIRHLQPRHIQTFPQFIVDEFVLPRHRDPRLCAQCALVRWLAVLHAYRHRSGRDVEELLAESRVYAHPRHDCADHLGDGWHTTPWLTPAIDQHGAIAHGRTVTTRAVTGILRRRFTPTDQQPQPGIPGAVRDSPRATARPTPAEQAEIGWLYDRVGDKADALNARIQRLLDGLEKE